MQLFCQRQARNSLTRLSRVSIYGYCTVQQCATATDRNENEAAESLSFVHHQHTEDQAPGWHGVQPRHVPAGVSRLQASDWSTAVLYSIFLPVHSAARRSDMRKKYSIDCFVLAANVLATMSSEVQYGVPTSELPTSLPSRVLLRLVWLQTDGRCLD